jgi:hypothetical protein
MALIHVPQPPKSAMNSHRPVNALLQAQMQHLQDAELKLPARLQTNIYVNAIKTEGEAGEYIRRVTEAIHQAHDAAAEKRARPVPKRTGVIDIAATAEDRPSRGANRSHAKEHTQRKSTKTAKKKRPRGRKG